MFLLATVSIILPQNGVVCGCFAEETDSSLLFSVVVASLYLSWCNTCNTNLTTREIVCVNNINLYVVITDNRVF